jgi:PAS domain S-box-containing protein
VRAPTRGPVEREGARGRGAKGSRNAPRRAGARVKGEAATALGLRSMRRMSRRSTALPTHRAETVRRAWVGSTVLLALSASLTEARASQECTRACDLGVGDRSRWRRIDADSGLPDLRVRELEEASDGTLWVATDRGVHWYDGFTFQAAEGLPKSAPSALVALRNGELATLFPDGLWRGSQAGWARVALEEVEFPTVPVGPVRSSRIRATDAGDLVLEGRHVDGVLRAHVEGVTGWRQVTEGEALLTRPTHFSDPHRGHMPFLTLEGGLLSISDNGVDGPIWPIPEDWLVAAAFPDPGGLGALVAVALPWSDRGVWAVGPHSRKRIEGTESEAVVTLDTSRSGEALVLLVGGTFLARAWDGIWRGPFRAPPELEAASVVRFLRSGDLVIGGRDRIAWLQRSRSPWDTVGLAHPTPASQLVLTLLPSRAGGFWAGTAAGLEHHAPNGHVTSINAIDDVRLHDVTALAEDEQGRLWIGSGSGTFNGILVLDGEAVTRFDDPSLPANVHALVTDDLSRVWVAGLPTDERPGGLWVYEHGRFRRIDLPERPDIDLRAYDVAFDAGERMHVATNVGLFCIEDGNVEQLLWLDSERGGRVSTVCSDGAGGAWFGHGASAPGLGHAHADGRIEYIAPIDGGREARTTDLVRDAEGRLWVGDEDGILFHDHGGLHRIEERAVGVQALAVQDGRVIVGTRGEGIVRFDPSVAATFETRVDLELDLVERDTLVASWTPRAFWSERPSAQMLTRHRLDDGVWSDWSLTRGARMSGLGPGEHSLVIEVLGSPLRTTPQRTSRSIMVHAPLWARMEVAIPLIVALLVVLALAAWSTMRWVGAARAHHEATARFEQLANNVRDVFWLVDWRTSEVLYVNPAHRSVAGLSVGASQTAAAWSDRLHPDDRPWLLADYRDNIERRGEWDAEFRLVRQDGGVSWVHARAFAIRDPSGAINRVAGIAEEFTERREAEVRQQRLSLELDHRVKNVLAQVAAIAEQTVARAADLPEFSRAFIGRVRSMARTHEALASNRWAGMPLHEVIQTALGPSVGEEHCTLTGPATVLTPRASTSLGLALHELGTNAVKYGALRDAPGTIEASWVVDSAGGVVLTWTERGSAAPRPAGGKGLGLSLVRGLIEHDLGGVVELRFEAHGLVAVLRIPGVVVSSQGLDVAHGSHALARSRDQSARACVTAAEVAAAPGNDPG